MSDIHTDKLRTEIEEILKNADLATTTAKKVRLELEKKLGVELFSRRKEIDSLVMDYVNNRPPTPEQLNSDEPDEEEEEAAPAPKRRRAASGDDKAKRSKSSKKKKKAPDSEEEGEGKKKKKSGGGGGKGNGYTRPLKLSPALAELMGEESMPRHEVVKRVWAIIKERNLYDKNNKQFAICDDSLYKVFGCKRFRTFGMMKYLKTHFYG